MANFFDQFDTAKEPEPSANFFDQFDAPSKKKAAPEPTPEEQSFMRSVADVPLKIGAGVVTGVRLISDAFGAGSGVSNALKGAEDWVVDLYSVQSKNDLKEVVCIMKEVEDKGVGD